MLHISTLWYFEISVIYTQVFRIAKFVIIPPCFVKQQYLWNIAIQPEVCYHNVWAYLFRLLTARGNIIVKQDYYDVVSALFYTVGHHPLNVIARLLSWYPVMSWNLVTRPSSESQWLTMLTVIAVSKISGNIYGSDGMYKLVSSFMAI